MEGGGNSLPMWFCRPDFWLANAFIVNSCNSCVVFREWPGFTRQQPSNQSHIIEASIYLSMEHNLLLADLGYSLWIHCPSHPIVKITTFWKIEELNVFVHSLLVHAQVYGTCGQSVNLILIFIVTIYIHMCCALKHQH